MNIPVNLTYSELKPGMVVVYFLRANQLPKHPEKEWRGKIKKVYQSIDEVEVEILSEGYKGDEERVHFKQIVRVESEEEQ
jgi:predicted adenine nucleotide alpha hydrolase (AANH) superfamily ATPase